jgi:hypothetical protein
MCATESIKLPAVIALEKQQREKQERHDLGGNDSDSDVPLAKKHVAAKPKRARGPAGTLTKSSKRKEDGPPPPKKRSKSKVKAPLGPTEDPSDQATNFTETVGTTGLREKNTSNADSETMTRIGADLDGHERNAQVLQEKTVPTKVPRKRKDHTEAAPDKEDNTNNEDTHGPPEKKRRRANNTARCVPSCSPSRFFFGGLK